MKDELERNDPIGCLPDSGARNDLLDALGQVGNLLLRHKICLVYHNHVGDIDLVKSDVTKPRGVVHNQLCVDNSDHVLDIDQPLSGRVEEGLGNGDRLGYTAGLDHDVLGPGFCTEDAKHLDEQVVTDGATNAAIGQADGLSLDRDDELGVDVDVAEVVHEHGDAAPRRVRQNVVE